MRMDNVSTGDEVTLAVQPDWLTGQQAQSDAALTRQHEVLATRWREADEARRRAEREACERNGSHEFEVLTTAGRPDPVAVVCDICGTEWEVHA